ncbi:MAG: PIN domain-containing protein [Bacteroidota bacterium]
MKLFLDANILVAILNKEMPLFTYAARVISLPSYNHKYKIYTTPICLATAFYFAEKKTSTKKALEKISLLSENINIISVGNEQVVAVRNNPKISDFEDGLQYYAAKEAGCQAIITENLSDFYFSEIPVYDCKRFILEIYR